jgi:hypothetical protein
MCQAYTQIGAQGKNVEAQGFPLAAGDCSNNGMLVSD